MTVESNNNSRETTLYEQRDILKLLIMLEEEGDRRERFKQRLQYINQLMESMKTLDNPHQYT